MREECLHKYQGLEYPFADIDRANMVVCMCEWQHLSRAKENKETGKKKKEKKNCGQFPRTFL